MLQDVTNCDFDVVADAELAMDALDELSALVRIGACVDGNCMIDADTFTAYMRLCLSKVDLMHFLLPHCLPLS